MRRAAAAASAAAPHAPPPPTPPAPPPHHDRRERRRTAEQRGEDRGAPAVAWLLDEAEHDRAETDHAQRATEIIHAHALAPRLVMRHSGRDREREDRDRDVQEEDHAPA